MPMRLLLDVIVEASALPHLMRLLDALNKKQYSFDRRFSNYKALEETVYALHSDWNVFDTLYLSIVFNLACSVRLASFRYISRCSFPIRL